MRKISSKKVKNILCLTGSIVLLFFILGLLNNNIFESFDPNPPKNPPCATGNCNNHVQCCSKKCDIGREKCKGTKPKN